MLKEQIIKNMQNIVENCMGDEEAACVATCPMHTDVKEYVRLIKEDKGEEAIRVIREKLFIPGTLGRICAHPCEKECKWKEAKSPMAIASLKRYAADNFDREENWDLTIKNNLDKKVAIIGSGPAGLQAALDLRKEGVKVTVFEKLPVRGGMMSVGIPEYRLPRNILEKELTYLDKLGVEFKLGVEIGKNLEFDNIINDFDAVVVAVGKHQGRVDKSLENGDAQGVYSAADYLREVSLTRNVEKIGRKVLVVGGGDVAMDCCRVSRRLNKVEEVFSICLEDSFDTMTSSDHEIKGAIVEGINFNHARAIKSIEVINGRVNKVVLKKCTAMFDEEGRFSPSYNEDDTTEIEVDTIVFAIGQDVEGSFAKDILVQRRNSTFECDKLTLQSSKNNKVFIAGDASGESVIVVQAMATGRRVAQSVVRFLNKKSLVEGRKIEDTWTFNTNLDMPTNWEGIEYLREGMKELSVKERINSFDEVNLGYTKEEALREANRCRQCVCKKCMKECIMLNDYTDCPKNLFKQYLENGYENMDKMIAFSCNECNQCTLECPKSLELAPNFIAIKEQYNLDNNGINVIDGLKPFDKSQEMECSEEYSTTVLASKEKKTKYLFVPGCTVPAYSPELVEKTLEHLRATLDGEVGSMLQCCGKVTKLIGEDEKFKERNKKAVEKVNETNADVIITVCPSCYNVYSETTDKKVIAYWDLIKDKIGLPEGQEGIGEGSDIVFNFHDSCVTRNVTSHHESVRWIVEKLGYKYDEIERSGNNTRCCGVGGMVCSSNPELYERVYNRRASDFASNHIISYCGSCRGTIEATGLDSIHILNLIHEDKYTKDKAKKRGYASEEEMWKNRLETKKRLDSSNIK
ncbi:FAD-dependent oxidoreductase [Clostridium septicum]|uniref:FAD-dependent oxidoreductase n=1 Tax=Clostridium septicum TaxID=1504 RepID=UPI00272E823F|nr:FAD-dependent oxidoreductase [Clostridium septicum]WLF69392.1 FAD-dependent oxidoreductase [Clostridium septicum]